MNIIINILAGILIFLSGGLLGYNYANYENTHDDFTEIHNDLFSLTVMMDLKIKHPEVFEEIRQEEYYKRWIDRNNHENL